MTSPNILIVAPAWVGDMVMAHCLVQVLIERHGSAGGPPAIDMLAPNSTAQLGARMPGVSETHILDVSHGELALAKRRRQGQSLAGRYQRAVVLPNSFKSALVPWWAKVPVRTGWHGEARFGLLNDRRRLDESRYPLMIERFMALGLDAGSPLPEPAPLPRLEVDADNVERLCAARHLSVDGGVTVLCPGAEYGPAKRWPSAHFAEVARHAAAQGHQVWLVGSSKDAPVCAEIEAQVPTGLVNLAGRTTLLDAIDLLSLADRVVSNDSGLMHVACALARPVVAVFGSTSDAFTPPLGAAAVVVREDIECSPCFERECPLGHLRCLNDLAPRRVIELLP
ncbi:MAG: lipopolysaccharide heptosyltransferase II [Gammaproteobacteria bacterium]|nr:lipopolysaccharide heptosyltransferase II [Gammaproteobacteria bacterium]